MMKEVADLCSPGFGAGLRLAVAMDETVASRVVRAGLGRRKSAIGRRAATVNVDLLDDDEFAKAVEKLRDHRAEIMTGGRYAHEYRAPWVLRAVMSKTVAQPEYRRDGLVAWMPPFLGLELLWDVREFPLGEDAARGMLGVARAVVDDGQDADRPSGLIARASFAYIVRRATLRRYLEGEDIEGLVVRGYVRPVVRALGIDALLVRTPELVASVVAQVVAEGLAERAEQDSEDAARWLTDAAGGLPLGEVVARKRCWTPSREAAACQVL